MQYMLIYKADENGVAGGPPTPEMMSAMEKLIGDMAKAGVLVGTGGLAPSSAGSRLRLAGGKFTSTDGPFTEAKELIGGYAIVEVKSKAEAVELARTFLNVCANVLGPSYVGESEIRLMHGSTDFAQQ
ncbi:MAG: YciI family protein [bacterium]